MTDNGEQPIWASKAKVRAMGQEWARDCFKYGELISVGNLVHDAAAKEEWARLQKR